MKLLILLLVLFGYSHCFAQCDNEVRTNPATKNNLELPDVSGATNTLDERYENSFNWWADGFYNLTNMQYNPTQPYVDISNVQDPFSIPYYSYLVEALGAEEMNPQNGWELLLVNLGRYPDNMNPVPITTLREIPYIGLYNKYSGKFRLFVQYGYNEAPNLAVDGLKIDLFYNLVGSPTNKSTILRLGSGIDKPLDQLNHNTSLKAICPPNGSAVSQWMSADFQLTYDPCVCNIPTTLSVEFIFFSETDFELTGRSISVVDDLVQNNQISNTDFLSGVSNDNKNGYIIYEKMGSLMDDYIAEQEAYLDSLWLIERENEKIKNALLVIKIAKSATQIGLLAATGAPTFASFASKWPALNFKKVVGGVTTLDSVKTKKFWETTEKILGEWSKLIISESLKKKPDPTKPVMPTVTLTEMQFSGTLNNEDYAPSLLFSTPGSFKNNTSTIDLPVSGLPQGYPVYNQPLGVFALLETPKLKQYKYSKEIVSCEDIYIQDDADQSGDLFIGTKKTSNIENKTQFKLNSSLVYTFNPALDYNSKEVSAMYVVKSKVKNKEVGAGNEQTTEIAIKPFKSKITDASVNVNSTTINTYANEDIWHYENFGSTLQSGDTLVQNDSLVYQTEFIPINAFNNFVFELATKENSQKWVNTCFPLTGNIINGFNHEIWEDLEIYLKIKVDAEFIGSHSNGEPHVYSYIFTYKIGMEDLIPVSGPFVPNIAGSNSDLLQYPTDLVFNGTIFNGSAVAGCELIGNTYNCQSWNNIELIGNIQPSAPFNVNFIAGNEVIMLPEAQVSPSCTLYIERLLDYSNPMPESSQTYVSGFCAGTNAGLPSYKGNLPNKTVNNTSESGLSLSDDLSTNSTCSFSLFPNPTSNNATILLDNPETIVLSLKVTDITGKEIFTELKQAINGAYELNLVGFAKGVYFVTLATRGGNKTKQLIVE